MSNGLGMSSGRDELTRAGFWPRLAATWIDWFVIYAIAALLVEFAAVVGPLLRDQGLLDDVQGVHQAASPFFALLSAFEDAPESQPSRQALEMITYR